MGTVWRSNNRMVSVRLTAIIIIVSHLKTTSSVHSDMGLLVVRSSLDEGPLLAGEISFYAIFNTLFKFKTTQSRAKRTSNVGEQNLR